MQKYDIKHCKKNFKPVIIRFNIDKRGRQDKNSTLVGQAYLTMFEAYRDYSR